MWELVPLGGKYYGTVIKNSESGVELKVWHTFLGGENSFIPSDRELSRENITREQWDNNDTVRATDCFGEVVLCCAKDIVIAADHFEDQESYEKALLVMGALNSYSS